MWTSLWSHHSLHHRHLAQRTSAAIDSHSMEGRGQEWEGRSIKAIYHTPAPGPFALVVAVACTPGFLKSSSGGSSMPLNLRKTMTEDLPRAYVAAIEGKICPWVLSQPWVHSTVGWGDLKKFFLFWNENRPAKSVQKFPVYFSPGFPDTNISYDHGTCIKTKKSTLVLC